MSSDSDERSETLTLSDRTTLKMLAALEKGEVVSQRGLASQVGVALGLTNSLLKRAVRKGLVKVQQVPAKRYAYYVTPKGFREKSQLVAQYLSTSLHFFRRAREEYSAIFSSLEKAECSKIVLYGIGELAEIAMISSLAESVTIAGIVHPGCNQSEFAGAKVISNLDDEDLNDVDAVVITHTSAPQEAYGEMVERYGKDKVYVANLLHVKTVD